MKTVCLHASTKQHVKGTNAPPRVVRLCSIDTARSTIKPRPQKRTVSANPCSVFTNVPFATLSHRRAHLCWRRDALPVNWHPIWNGERVCATSGVQRRRDNQRRTDEATCLKRKPHGPQPNCRRSKCASTRCPRENTCPRTWCQQSYDGHNWHV